MKHLTFAHYMAVLHGELPPALLHHQAHQHVLADCPGCRQSWAAALDHEPGSGDVETHLGQVGARGAEWERLLDLPEDSRALSLAHVERAEGLEARVRQEERTARKDLWRLSRLPLEAWPDRVANARTRMRSRAFAHLLIEESRRRVKTAPREAAALAALVRPALDRRQGRLSLPWARTLLARAMAHRANALRVAGELNAAAELFSALHQEFTVDRLDDWASRAEIQSLEASLCLAQRRFEKAGSLLDQVAETCRGIGNTTGLCRTLIQKANLLLTVDRPAEVQGLLEHATRGIDASSEPYLYFCTLQARALAFLDLDRPEDAASLVSEKSPLWLEQGSAHTEALYTALRARIATARGQHVEAAAGFTSARDQLLELDRDYDAILASLDIADALLAAGRTAEAGELALSLVPMFQSRGVARETLAALRLLAEAARTEAVTARLVAQVRDRLDAVAGA